MGAEPTVTFYTDGSVKQHGPHSLSEATQMHWDRVETQAIIRTIERLDKLGRLKGDKETIAALLGVSLLS